MHIYIYHFVSEHWLLQSSSAFFNKLRSLFLLCRERKETSWRYSRACSWFSRIAKKKRKNEVWVESRWRRLDPHMIFSLNLSTFVFWVSISIIKYQFKFIQHLYQHSTNIWISISEWCKIMVQFVCQFIYFRLNSFFFFLYRPSNKF